MRRTGAQLEEAEQRRDRTVDRGWNANTNLGNGANRLTSQVGIDIGHVLGELADDGSLVALGSQQDQNVDFQGFDARRIGEPGKSEFRVSTIQRTRH